MRRRSRYLALAALALPVVAVFSLGITAGHIGFDDWGYTGGCPFVKDGFSWANVARAFCDLGYGAIWMPVTFMSHMADATLFGGSWRAYHATNVVLHICNFVLVALFYEMLLKRLVERPGRTLWLASLAAALMWAVHPMRADVVSYVASRKEELWTMFALAGLMAYMKFLGEGKVRHYSAAFAMFALACLSKPTAMCFPLLAASMHVLPDVRRRWRRLLWLRPMLLVSVLVGLVAMHSQAHPTGGDDVGLYDARLSWRILNAAVSTGLYLYYTVLPAGIHMDYLAVFNGWPHDGWLGLGVLAAAVLASALVFAAAGGRTCAVYLFAVLLAAFSLGPTLGVLGYVNGDQAMADRYTYFPHVAAFFLVAFLAARFAWEGKKARAAAVAFCAAVALECAFAVPVVRSYESGYAASLRTLSKDPGNWRALRIVGNAYCARMGRCEEGIAMLRRSLRTRPSKTTADSLSYILAMKGTPGDFAEVRRMCAGAIRAPETDRSGMMLDALGIVCMREGDYRSAARFLSAGLRASARRHPADYTTLWLGVSLANSGRRGEAASAFRRVCVSRIGHVRRRAEEALAMLRDGGVPRGMDWAWAEGGK